MSTRQYIILIILITFAYTDTVCSQEPSLVKEDFVGDWQGKINGENIEIAIWFTKRGLDSALGGYVIFPDSNCIQQFSYSEPSDHLWQYAKESNRAGELTRKEYFNSYRLITTHPSWLDKNQSCIYSEVVSNMGGAFFVNIFIKEFGQSVELAYSLATDRVNDDRKKHTKEVEFNKKNKLVRMKNFKEERMGSIKISKLKRAIKKESSAKKIQEIELEIKKLTEKARSKKEVKIPVYVYKAQPHRDTLTRNVLSSTMLSLVSEKRHFGSHPKPSKEEMIILQSTEG